MSQPVKLSDQLVLDARLAAQEQDRSIAGQVEYWAKLGRSIDALIEGRERQKLMAFGSANPISDLIESVDAPLGRARLLAHLESEPFPHYEAHPKFAGFLIRTEKDGSRTVGRFVNRKFLVDQELERAELNTVSEAHNSNNSSVDLVARSLQGTFAVQADKVVVHRATPIKRSQSRLSQKLAPAVKSKTR